MSKFTILIEKEKNSYLAKCVEVNVFSQGHTPGTALDNIKEALELYVESNKRAKLKDIQVAIIRIGDKK